MKNIDQTPEEETLPTEQRPTRRAPVRRMPPPDADDVLPPSRRSAANLDARTRLARRFWSSRFSQPIDLKLLAVTWAADYTNQVFPLVEDDQRLRLLVAAETSFLASIQLGKDGIRHWGQLLEEAKKARDAFLLK